MMLYLVHRLVNNEDLIEKQFTPADFQAVLDDTLKD